ncbi:MAG: diaminopimelate epimerase [Actinobacteria bacterium RBG_19FT_COMBO_54_7]|uniref:Diaminopimelate epimerase n=1 Tax=Candidatus Solincola sediminis TaxID=1797199 RepID=A0A1F2WGH8_9ACTN|nr:MAG: diaminopimelate epimerase [Candidatus Solincola sediminis]OFW56231.1 MAG: diaminopimelate epimerase [Candidatus Solincola sediminis]OFW70489.1 MAG: diaminopimelate epimerase [Actinobacteria bacterium RBG_19FT_COMBO_54_7]
MDFYKYHGTGNDFIILDCRGRVPFLSPREIEELCRRHTGIGADGIIFASDSSTGAEAEMRLFNADGSEAEMSGNGIRCLAKYLFEREGISKEEMLIDTRAGAKAIKLEVAEGRVSNIEVDMGIPDFTGNAGETSILLDSGEELRAICLSMGNPHCVIFVNDVGAAEVERLGPLVETHSFFPARTNVEFAQVASRERLLLRVWERGVGETDACGTGSCAAFAAAINRGLAGKMMVIGLKGGELKIKVDDYGHLHLAGPAVEVFAGELSRYWRGQE